MFTPIIQDKLLIASTPDELNNEVTQLLNRITPILKKREENSLFSRLFSKKVDMNYGVHDLIAFDAAYLSSHPEMASIVRQAHALMTSNGFNVDPKIGVIWIDVYDIDSDTPIESYYSNHTCDNDVIVYAHHSCAFHAQKDAGVQGDMEIYTKQPTFCENGQSFVLPITSQMTMLRHGDQMYTIQPRLGKGKEMILTISFDVL